MSPVTAVAATEATYPVTVAASHLTQEWKDRRSLTWAALCHRLTDHRVGAKAGPCFTPATFRGTSRLKDDAEVIGLAVLDLDDGSRSLAEIKAAVGQRGWAAIIYTTFRHTPNHPKFRVVVPLERPWQASHYPSRGAANTAWRERYFALAAALNVVADPACTDPSRLYYLPRHPEGAAFETAIIEGVPCDIWSLPAAPTDQPAPANDKPASRPESGQIDGARLRYAAAALDGELAAVQSAREGTRNQTLNTAALKLGGLCAAGLLTEGAVRTTLTNAALTAGLPMPEITATLNSGLRAGMAKPRDIPERTHQPRQHQGPPHPEYDPETGEIYDRDPRPEPPPVGDANADPTRTQRTADAPTDTLDDLINPVDLHGIEPPDREWVVDGWLSKGTVALFAGAAGVGKSLLAQQLQESTALGVSFLGLDTIQCKTLAFYCEDDNDELHRRGKSICYHYGVSLSQLSDIRWQGRFGKQNVLVTFDGDGLLQTTPFYDFIVQAMRAIKPGLLILDNAAQLFGGNENDRSQVTQFVNLLGRIAVEHNCAALLLAHPGKSETGATAQYSGSTAWDAAVRCRWILERPKPEDEQDARELADLRVLRKVKSNYSSIGDEIALKWDQGAFAAVGGAVLKDTVDRIDEQNQEHEDDERFLRCLDILASQDKGASDSRNSPNFAPKVMAKLEPWKSAPKVRHRVQAAMDRLFNAGVILANQVVRPGSKKLNPLYGIARKPVDGAGQSAGGRPETAGDPKPEAGDQKSRPETPSQVIEIIRPETAGGSAGDCRPVSRNPLESQAGDCRRLPAGESPHTPHQGQWPDDGIGHGPVAEKSAGTTWEAEL